MSAWNHSVNEVIAEAAKLYEAQLRQAVETARVCADCRVRDIEVIHRPATWDVEVIDESGSLTDGGMRLRIIETVRLLCLECSRRRYDLP